jgi:hypothetical protein
VSTASSFETPLRGSSGCGLSKVALVERATIRRDREAIVSKDEGGAHTVAA